MATCCVDGSERIPQFVPPHCEEWILASRAAASAARSSSASGNAERFVRPLHIVLIAARRFTARAEHYIRACVAGNLHELKNASQRILLLYDDELLDNDGLSSRRRLVRHRCLRQCTLGRCDFDGLPLL